MLECYSCYEMFAPREGFPELKVCSSCEPNPLRMNATRCPRCGWDSALRECNEEAPVKVKNWYGFDVDTWNEEWTCPECGTVFDYDNSI